MKKIFLFCAAFLGALASFAQSDTDYARALSFVNEDGTEVTSGSEVTRTTIVDDPLGLYPGMIESGLYVKPNYDGDEVLGAALRVKVTRIDNGTFQYCFPQSCQTATSPLTNETSAGAMSADYADNSLQTEWYLNNLTDYGEVNAELTLLVNVQEEYLNSQGKKRYRWVYKTDGPTVKLNLVNRDPTAINGVTDETSKKVVARYAVGGQQISSACKGINIVRYSDGSVRKVNVR